MKTILTAEESFTKSTGCVITHWSKPQEAFVFTPEQLNKYTANVIKQALETAAEKAETVDTYKTRWSGLNKENYVEKDVYKQSITNTFEQTYKKFKI